MRLLETNRTGGMVMFDAIESMIADRNVAIKIGNRVKARAIERAVAFQCYINRYTARHSMGNWLGSIT